MYLTIITTALVITQIIRLIQNSIQLKHLKNNRNREDEIINEWKKLIDAIDKMNKESEDK